ncbi:hypothetical protein BBK36DRAFT_1110832 [Trichoderma citrinoviride]|uniref:Uncharacterized protein n=1 Tax=Trichoderma citrinoviride TaxID=58853 RepID=A0A2T4BJE2_9HYPO|nr:hypothetical protein BBK36DRAFT_1110832 [Trichoderma citrinoviride]PTB69425.1 hypothetical protein BBK36DRAFT_1110832 [Trichoderma citrinoviride]
MTQITGLGELRPRNGSGVNWEIGSLLDYVRRSEFVPPPNTFVVLVCRHGAVEGLTAKIHRKRQKEKFSRWKRKNVAIKATDDLRLNAVISAAEKAESYDNLIIIASGFVSHFGFDVGSSIMDLKVYRCGSYHNHEEYLYLDGTSTFHGQPLRSWESKHHEAKFWLGPGVVLDLGSQIGQLGNLSDDDLSSMSDFDQEKVRSNIEMMIDVKMEDSWWDKFRDCISAIVDVLARAAGFAHVGYIKMTAGGMFVQYKFVGFALYTGTVAAAAAAAVAGSAVSAGTALLVAPGVSAAIYFIPWESVFDWLKSVVSWLTAGIKKVWEKVKDWLAAFASKIRDTLGLDGWSAQVLGMRVMDLDWTACHG